MRASVSSTSRSTGRVMPAGSDRSLIGEPSARKMRAGVTGGHESARPVLGAVDRAAFAGEHHDEAGQVIVRRAEAVIDPRAEGGAAALQAAGVHHQQAGAVDGRLGRHRVEERDVVDAVAEVREQVADPFAALAALAEFPARLDDAAFVLVPAAAERFHGDRFAVHADHRRLVIERVDVARPAVHEQKDDALGFGRAAAAVWARAGWRCKRRGSCAAREEAVGRQERGRARPRRTRSRFPKETHAACGRRSWVWD